MPNSELRKAAIVLMSLPEEEAAQILGKLESRQAEAVMIEIAKLGAVTSEEQGHVIHEFAEASPSSTLECGGIQKVRQLAEKGLGENASRTMETVRQHIEALPFGFLKNVDSQNLLTFILDEHPQTIALVLSHLQPQRAADIITALPPDRQLAVIRRVATMGQTSPEIIAEVERGLESRLSMVMRQQYENAGGAKAVAEILNVTDRTVERTLLENMAEDNPELVEEIRRMMFVFDDIVQLSDKDIQSVLKNVETSQWAMALKGASEALKQKIMGNLSTRAAELLKEEMEYLGAVRVSDVDSVRQQIVDIVRRLEEAGEIAAHADDEGEQFIQ